MGPEEPRPQPHPGRQGAKLGATPARASHVWLRSRSAHCPELFMISAPTIHLGIPKPAPPGSWEAAVGGPSGQRTTPLPDGIPDSEGWQPLLSLRRPGGTQPAVSIWLLPALKADRTESRSEGTGLTPAVGGDQARPCCGLGQPQAPGPFSEYPRLQSCPALYQGGERLVMPGKGPTEDHQTTGIAQLCALVPRGSERLAHTLLPAGLLCKEGPVCARPGWNADTSPAHHGT